MKHKKKIIVWLLAAAMGVSLFACASENTGTKESGTSDSAAENVSDSATDSSSDDGLFTLRVITQTSFNELNVADELGFFRDEGIKIEYIGVLGQGVTEFQLMEQGEIDAFTGGHPPGVAQARLAGIDVVSVAPGMVDDPEYPHVRYLVQADSSIQSLDEAVGKTVGISGTGACTDGYVKYYLKSKGLDPDSVNFVTLSTSGQQEQALGQGLINISTSHPPYAGIALATGEYREILNSWDIFHSPGAGLSVRGFTQDFIDEYPDVVQGFVNAMYRSRIWIDSNLDSAKEIVAKYLSLNSSDLSSFLYDTDKNITASYIDQWFEIAETIGLWNEGDIEPEETYTNAFVPDDIPDSDATLTWTNTDA